MVILENEPLSCHTTFKIGGKARYFTQPLNTDDLQSAIGFAREKSLPILLIGNGSNLLVSDRGFAGLAIKTTGLSEVSVGTTGTIVAWAGAKLSQLSAAAYENGRCGLEFAGGIPGTVGGGIYMNCGAYGGEIADYLCKVAYLDNDLNIRVKERSELDFSYRHSYFKDHDKLVILWGEFDPPVGEKEQIGEKMKELAAARRNKQPLEYPSAGSTFKRPEGFFAAKLIEDCGLKGLTVGGAMVSEKHAGFVINKGKATCADVLNLVKNIKQRVLAQTGVTLECEIKIVGE